MNNEIPPARPSPEDNGWSPTTRLVMLLFTLAVCLWLLWLARPFWWLLVFSSIIAYLLQPLITVLTRLKVPRGIATFFVVMVVLALVVLVILFLIPSLLIDLQPISFDLSSWLNSFSLWVQELPQQWPGIQFLGIHIDFMPLYRQIIAGLSYIDLTAWLPRPSEWIGVVNETIRSAGNLLGFATNLATSFLAAAFAILLGLMLLLIFTLYLTKDMPLFFETIVQLAPEDYRPEWRELWRRTGQVWHAFFRGQLLLSMVVGISVWLGLRFIGLPGALALGMIAGILEILPNIGPILSLIPAIFIALLAGSPLYPDISHFTVMLVVVALYTLIQQLENYILVPRILGSSVGVHPIFVLGGVLVFSFHFGVLGAFVAAPVLATLRTWGEYVYARLLGQYPYPEILAESSSEANTSSTDTSSSSESEPRPTVVISRPSSTPPPPRPKS
ncbi:MAG: AI-2E family transporter [Chloroflexi bacterium]|nr:AI-2E family transporter [Chloroflexota bacterium]